MKRFGFIIAILVFSIPAFAQQVSNYNVDNERGKIEAAEDLKNEKFVFKTWGLVHPTSSSRESAEEIYKRILKEQYNITFESVGGCLVDEDVVTHAKSYNEVLKAGIEARYGTGILETIRKQAQEEYEAKYGEMEPEFGRPKEEIQSPPKK